MIGIRVTYVPERHSRSRVIQESIVITKAIAGTLTRLQTL